MTNITVTTAVPLTDKQVSLITATVTKKMGKDFVLNQVVSTEVVGGVRLTIGSTQLDATVRHKLEVLKSQLMNI